MGRVDVLGSGNLDEAEPFGLASLFSGALVMA
jgi:hypothetical protein